MITKISNSFCDAIRLLTILPLPDGGRPPRPSLLYWFPVIGLLMGLSLAGTDWLLMWMSPRTIWISPILLVSLWLILSRGLHIDGLADTFDAIGSVGDRSRRLEILRDPHIGSMGVTAIVMLLFAKMWTLMSLSHEIRSAAFIGSAVSARWVIVLACAMFPYARKEGMGAAFIGQAKWVHVVMTSIITISFFVFFTTCAGTLLILTAAAGIGIAWLAHQSFGGITGDVLGAIVEVTECAGLAVFVFCT